MVSFDAPSSSVSLRVFICEFSSKTRHIFSISHNLGLLERGNSLVFSSPALKRWNHGYAIPSVMTPSPSTFRILRAVAAVYILALSNSIERL